MGPSDRSRERPATRKALGSIALFFVGVVVTLVAGGIMARVFSRSLCDVIRYAGMLLQIVGVGVVVHDLLRKRVEFGRLGLLAAILNVIGRGWARLVAWVKPPRVAHLEVHLEDAVGVAVGEVAGAAEQARPTLEERVSALEDNVRRLRGEVDTKIQGVQGDVATVTSALQQEEKERRAADEQAQGRLEDVEIGRLHVNMVGLLWVILGIVGTSMPTEGTAALSWFAWIKTLVGWLQLTTAC